MNIIYTAKMIFDPVKEGTLAAKFREEHPDWEAEYTTFATTFTKTSNAAIKFQVKQVEPGARKIQTELAIQKLPCENAYAEAEAIVEAWCKEHIVDTMLVSLLIGDRARTVVLEPVNGPDRWEWEYDWWEGEKDVLLLGFRPAGDVQFYDYPGAPCRVETEGA